MSDQHFASGNQNQEVLHSGGRPETYLDDSQTKKSKGFVDGVMDSMGMGNGNDNDNDKEPRQQATKRGSEESPSNGDDPGRVGHKIRDHIAPNAAVVSSEKKPGLSKNDRPAGTAFPVAGVANKSAVDPSKVQKQSSSVPNKDAQIDAQERKAEEKAGAVAVPDNKLPGNAAYQKNYTPMDRKATAEEFDLIQGGPGIPGLSDRIEAGGEDNGKVSDSIDGAYIEKMAAKNIPEKKIPEPVALGWKQMGGWSEEMGITSDEQADDLITKSTLLEEYIANKFYGDWYHNIACIVVTGVLSFLVAKLGGGTAWLILVLAVSGTYYRTSIRRLRRNVRDDITREAAVKRIESEEETMEWLNLFMTKFWVIYEPVLAATVVQIGNQVLAGSTPGFIESMAIESFTLGTKPPRVDHVRTFPKTEDDVSIMDWKFSFTPNDTEDLTARQLKNKVNPKVVLAVRIGKGVVSKALPILLEDMSFSGHVRIRIRMMTLFPHIQTVDISFLEPPDFDFVLKPIGGETLGFDINVIPGLTSFIHEMVHANIGPMMYAPNAFQLNVQQMLSGSALDSAVGVLAITVYRAGNLKGSGRIGNTVDPYIVFWLKNEENGRTSVKKDTCNPRWNETKYLLVNNLTEVLRMEIIDFNDFRTDKTIGSVSLNLDSIASNPEQKGIHGEVLEGRKKKGTLVYDARWFPVLEGKTLEDGTVEPPPESPSGILRVVINQCKDLDPKQSMVGQLSPYVELAFNGKLLHNTNVVKRSNNPVWDDAFEFLVTDKDAGKVSFVVKDSRGMSSDPVIGKIQKTVDDLVESTEDGEDWHDFADAGRMRISALWKPLGLSGVGGGTGYVEPIGVLRFHIIKANDLRNLETVGKVDPYVRVLVGGYARCRTRTITANLDPVWDEYIYAPVHSSHERITVECMDSEKVSHDRSLGKFEHRASSIIKTDEDGNYIPHIDKKGHVGELQLGKKSPKGRIEFYCSFYPCLPVLSPAEQKKKAEMDEKKAATQSKTAPSITSSKKEGGSSWWGGAAKEEEDPQADLKKSSSALGKVQTNGSSAKGGAGAIDSTGMDGSEQSTVRDEPKAMSPEEQKAKIKADTKAKADAAKDKTKAAQAADKAGSKDDATVKAKAATAKAESDKPEDEADHPVGGVDESSGGDAFEGKLDWSFDKIVSNDTGLLPFTMKSYKVTGERDCYLQVLFDEFAIPKWSSGKIKENNPQCNETSDAMIRELYQSKMTIRLTSRKSIETDEERKEHLLGSHTMPTFDFLKSSYGKDFKIGFDTKRGRTECIMSSWYLPLEFSIDPCESLDNMGYLKVSVLDAHDLPAADRSGKSDPYAIFNLEGKRVFKTKTQKKTLDPVWNEFFEMAISSLIKADFSVVVWDWDMGPADDDFLGETKIDLSDVLPHEENVKVLDLVGEDGEHAGSIRLAFNFSPEYIPKTWQGKSMMSGAVGTPGKIITSVAGAPIKGIGFVGHGVHRGASKLKRAIFGRHKDKGDEDSEGEMHEDDGHGGGEHDLNEDEPGVSHFGGPSSARNPHAAENDTGAGHTHLSGAMDGAHNAVGAVGGAVGGAGHAVGGAFSGLKDKVAARRAGNASYDDDPNVDVDAVNAGEQPRKSGGIGSRVKGMMSSNHEDDPNSPNPTGDESASAEQSGHRGHNPFGKIGGEFDKVGAMGSKMNPFGRKGDDKSNDGDHLKAPVMPDARKSMERKSMESRLSPSETRGSIMSSRTGRTGHSRSHSTASNHGAAALFQGETFPGTLTIVRARGFQGTDRLQIKVYLSGRKDRELWKKRVKPTEREDYDINQEVDFKAEPTAKLVISCKEDKTFGRSEHFGRWSVNVAEIKNGEQEIEFGENGFMRINLHFEQPDLSERLG